MAVKLDDISVAIGDLRAEVRGLRRDIEASDADRADATRRADEHRATIHRRVDDLVSEVGDLKTDVAGVQKDVADMKPVTDDVRRWKLMGLGALGIVGIGGTAFGVLLSKPLESLAAFLRGG